ncbi:hypothetical protein METBIDRAFT_30408 [Metschnikowia bicuspidata var. bicuspidata NRRL YB-4993]|uniref:Lariat debranching enzyme C-terminal domain-containing protein n=1 Tax=Metschnikowia bicuspidata var. bicuspidata NRRL YB-4993 TaxID=869754 RepID=A0A1A0HJJ9_9ASCO|nr:hypothetical protein METBIDRAFT_30408 [Metschnikowia bicuspidata var. bicuspidata NRRL YB-4993]OBA24062.1 hypothetical protein METBIDRAFT_30408 [Metschnikowia bicuspidata var. bicuspidata NRRL YB-4993]
MSTNIPDSDSICDMKPVRIAVEGCCHGKLNKIYLQVPKNAELLVICGDFQAIRNQRDLKAMNVPQKYLEMGDFPNYYLGKKKAPILTVFIGGNHELSLYLRELQYGGWVAPGIYYLGEFGTIWYKGLRILGASGIYSHDSFVKAKSDNPPAYKLPYNHSTIRSIYHVKPKNFLKLMLSGSSDVMLSHDWPKGIWEWGNKGTLLKNKPFLKTDIERGHLGSPLATTAMTHLKPKNWFSLHMHTFFEATVKHESPAAKTAETSALDPGENKRRKISVESEKLKDANEIALDMDDMDVSEETSGPDETLQMEQKEESKDISPSGNTSAEDTEGTSAEGLTDAKNSRSHAEEPSSKITKKDKKKAAAKFRSAGPETYFMALDKCLPRRSFIAAKSIEANPQHPSFKNKNLYYDPRAIAIQKVVENFVKTPNWADISAQDLLEPEKLDNLLAELNEMVDFEAAKIPNNSCIPKNFKKVAPDVKVQVVPMQYWPNNQTKDYCEKWGVPEPDLEGP